MEYYYLVGLARVGPVSISELKSLSGLGVNTLIQPGGIPPWVRADRLPELSEYFALNPRKWDNSFYESSEYAAMRAEDILMICIFPDQAYYYMGRSYFRMGEYAESISCYERCISINPRYAYAHNNMGYSYAKLKKYAEAIACYERCIAIDPNHVSAHKNMGVAYRNLGEYAASIASYARCV
jgi:tetratricopeptide (TPR) repeat protein